MYLYILYFAMNIKYIVWLYVYYIYIDRSSMK